MGLKLGLQLLQQTGKVVSRYTDDVVGLGVRNWAKPTSPEGLRYTPIESSKISVIPEYLYHLTNKKHYKLILKDGKILMSRDTTDRIPKCPGVFMIDIKNFFRNWGNNKSWLGCLKTKLVQHATHDDSNLIMLRIPTKLLDKSKIVLRDQEMYMGHINELRTELKELNIAGDFSIPAEFKRKFTFYFDGIPPKDISTTDIDTKSLEYIYRGVIPISKVEKVGEFDTLRDLPDNERSPMHFIFSGLLKGQPEECLAGLLV